jgi:putative transcriptional regulator
METKEILYKLRVNRNLSQQNVADELGVDISTYARYEKGKPDIKLQHAKKLADFYGLTLDQFFNYGEEYPQYASPTIKDSQVEESLSKAYKRMRSSRVSLMVELDGSEELADKWIGMIKQINQVVKSSV